MSDSPWRDLLEAGEGGMGMFTEAVRVVHGSSPIDKKRLWTLCAATAVSGAAGGVILAADRTVLAATGQDIRMALAGADAEVRHSLLTGQPVRARPLAGDLPHLLIVPVAGEGETHGAIVLAPGSTDEVDPAVEALASTLATNLGIALDNIARTAELAELEAARRNVVHQLQEAVRPATPRVEGAELGVYFLPADPESPTGGDLYDWQLLPDGDLHLTVIDVVGKGVGATKDALALAHVIRVLVLQGGEVQHLIGQADALYGPHHPDVAATLVVGRYTPATGALRLAGGGHPPPLVVGEDGSVRYIDIEGTALGYPGAGSRQVASLTLGRSDTLILYTDGLIEARRDILLGLDDLAAAATETARYPAVHQARALVERALAGAARRDDSLALVLRRRLPPTRPSGHRLAPFAHSFGANAASIGLARHLFSDWLRLQGVDADEAANLVLVASELCANGIAAGSDRLELHAFTDGSDVIIEVRDDAGGFRSVHTFDDVPDTERENGRGLFLVHSLTDEVAVLVDNGSHTVVRARRHGVLPPVVD